MLETNGVVHKLYTNKEMFGCILIACKGMAFGPN